MLKSQFSIFDFTLLIRKFRTLFVSLARQAGHWFITAQCSSTKRDTTLTLHCGHLKPLLTSVFRALTFCFARKSKLNHRTANTLAMCPLTLSFDINCLLPPKSLYIYLKKNSIILKRVCFFGNSGSTNVCRRKQQTGNRVVCPQKTN